MIAEHEGFDRGWYAGPVGWLGADGDGELMVALRCGLVEDRTRDALRRLRHRGRLGPRPRVGGVEDQAAAVASALGRAGSREDERERDRRTGRPLRGVRRGAGPGRHPRRGRLPRLALHAAGARPPRPRRRSGSASCSTSGRPASSPWAWPERRGGPAVLLGTSGTAAVNFAPAVVEASLGRVPLVVLTADRPPELRDRGAPQTIDQVRLYGRHAKWFAELP